MAIAAVPEAATAVESAGSGVAAGQESLAGARASARPRRPARPVAAPQQRKQREQPPDRRRKPRKRGFLDAPKGRSYQPVILAEFLVAILVVAVVPVAKGGSPEARAKGSPSPYSVGDVKQMVGIGAVYFVLALFSGSRKWGRMAAWFGGLVLAALGLAQTRGGGITALFSIFGTAQPGSGQGQGIASPSLQDSGAPFSAPSLQDSGAPFAAPSLQDSGQVTRSYVYPPPGGTGVITTTGSDQGVNLALPDARVAYRQGRR